MRDANRRHHEPSSQEKRAVNSISKECFHNVAELEPAPCGGQWLRRYPASVRRVLSPLGRQVSEDAAGCELRFVTDSNLVRLHVALGEHGLEPYETHPNEVLVYRGAFFHSRHTLQGSGVQEIVLSDVPVLMQRRFEKLATLPPHRSGADWFTPRLWRVLFGRRPAAIYGLDAGGRAVEPPTAADVPAWRWLAYGSSITHGSLALSHHNSYIYHAARQLKADVFNLGLAGSALCEPEVAGFIAGRKDWQMATFELGINMRGGFTPQEFEKRAGNFLRTIHAAHPDKPVGVIGIYDNYGTEGIELDGPGELTEREREYGRILPEIVRSLNAPNYKFLDPREILQDFTGLHVDLIHPADHGMVAMGANLARLLVKNGLTPAPKKT